MPPGVWMMRSMGVSSGVRRMARRTPSLSSMSMYRAMGRPKRLRVSCLWMR